jgi:hypothetical protein
MSRYAGEGKTGENRDTSHISDRRQGRLNPTSIGSRIQRTQVMSSRQVEDAKMSRSFPKYGALTRFALEIGGVSLAGSWIPLLLPRRLMPLVDQRRSLYYDRLAAEKVQEAPVALVDYSVYQGHAAGYLVQRSVDRRLHVY